MRYLYLLTLLFFSSGLAQAQSDEQPVKRYMGTVELGYLYGNNKQHDVDNFVAAPTVTLFNGIRLHRLLAIGATTGFDFYNNLLITPFALGIRGEMLNTRISPIYSIDAGYGSSFLSHESDNEKKEGGWMFNPALGFRVRSGNSTAYTFAAGYKTQKAETVSSWGHSFTEQKITFKRLSVQLGFMF
ncbi:MULTISPECIES: hypothetical protein [Pontibacter]|uniref:Outer membrane protein beta-barrel domain-containing protein n=1 Tax=Pontibacter lucknowensis TaxID=1077936 RepID=A0A1N6YB37_9BACT|nr:MULTISPECIES: hypothetical protein [Pontibacter]EJF11425.1 hypothetical protein O71_03144 [Pontibacter sp. BAB1700]SIR11784.1 hypothetical protein SAMN05421545_2390 [Pontibacter lucknowensis]